MVDLFGALPPRYGSCGDVTLLLQALQQELERLEAFVRVLGARGLVAEADGEGLALWETELGLPHRPDLTEAGRRAILWAALDRCYDGTAAGLAAYVQRLTGNPALVRPAYSTYGLTVSLEDAGRVDRYSLQHWVDRCLPVHIAGRVELGSSG